MEFRYDEIDGDLMILTADGGLNQRTADQFVSSVETLVDAGLRRLIIDCSALDYVSSFGLGVLVRLHRRMQTHGGDVKIAAVSGFLAQALQATRLNSLFEIYPDVNRAKLAFRPKDA